MSDETLRALAEAATPGPWMWRGNVDHDEPRLTSRRMDVLAIGHADRSTTDRAADDVRSYANECGEDPEEAVEMWATDNYGEPIKEPRLWFYTDGFAKDARKQVVYEVAPNATDREDRGVYRADIIDIRHPDARYIAAANPTAILALIAERDHARAQVARVEALRIPIAKAICQSQNPNVPTAWDHFSTEWLRDADAVLACIRAALETPDA